jgi:hypothetical protein
MGSYYIFYNIFRVVIFFIRVMQYINACSIYHTYSILFLILPCVLIEFLLCATCEFIYIVERTLSISKAVNKRRRNTAETKILAAIVAACRFLLVQNDLHFVRCYCVSFHNK